MLRSLGRTRAFPQPWQHRGRRAMGRSPECPVVVPRELLQGFHRAKGIPAPFGEGISLADHCLQMATDVLHASWVPNLYRRDMVVMSIFHDIYYADSPDGHGAMAAGFLEGRIHPHVLDMLRNHKEIDQPSGCGELFSPSTHTMLNPFNEFDIHANHGKRDWLPLNYFQEHGFFRVATDATASVCPQPSWLSPNGSLVWAAPSLWIERTPILLAQKLDLFKAAGLPALELTITDGGPELLDQVRKGRVHVAEIGMFPFLAAMDSTTPPEAKIIGSTFIQQLDHYLATGDLAITSIEQLRGRRVGVLSKGSCDSYLLKAMLKRAGVDPADVEEVPLGALYGSMDVLSGGTVDATFLVEPALSHAEDLGLARVLQKASCTYPRFQWGGLLASNHLLHFEPRVLLRVLEVYKDACRLMHEAVMTGANQEVLAVLSQIGPEWFQVGESTFLRALRRDACAWQLDWESIDLQGTQVCADIQRDLGVFRLGSPRVEDFIALDVRKRAEEDPSSGMAQGGPRTS